MRIKSGIIFRNLIGTPVYLFSRLLIISKTSVSEVGFRKKQSVAPRVGLNSYISTRVTSLLSEFHPKVPLAIENCKKVGLIIFGIIELGSLELDR